MIEPCRFVFTAILLITFFFLFVKIKQFTIRKFGVYFDQRFSFFFFAYYLGVLLIYTIKCIHFQLNTFILNNKPVKYYNIIVFIY